MRDPCILGFLFLSLTINTVSGQGSAIEGHLCDVETGAHCKSTEKCLPQSGTDKVGICKCIDGFERITGELCTPIKNSSEVLHSQNTSFSLHIQTEASLLKSSTIIPSLSSKSAILTEKFEEKVGESPEVYIKECGKTSSDYINVELPRSELYLCGYSSIKENVSYRWFRVDKLSSELPIDVTGSTTTNLTLTNIQSNELVGPYQFRLDVSGPKGRNASKSIKIYVIKANDLHPVVDAGGNYTVLMPENSVQLKGKVGNSNNSSFQWIQIDGPSKVSILNSDRVNATIGDLREGLYHMQLTVTGAKNSSNSADAFINVQKNKNEPPVARANNVTVHLPTSIAILNASLSSDDSGVISYDWRPLDNVPASLIALDGSEKKAVMFVWGLVCGLHGYNLTVRDQQNETDSILVYLNVEQGEEEIESVEILMSMPINTWTYRLRRKLRIRIAASLASSIQESDSVSVYFTRFEEAQDGRVRGVLWARINANPLGKPSVMVTPSNIVKAIHIVNILGEENSMIGEFHISDIQTLYCKLDCSGHGICSDATKECMCARFWMSNLIIFLINGMKHEDCAWSSIYFWIIVAVFSTIGASCFLFRRRSGIWSRVGRRKFKRRRRYSVLHSDSEDDKKSQRIRNGHVILNRGPRLAPLPIPHSSDSIDSESDDLLHKDRWEIQMKERTSTMNNHE